MPRGDENVQIAFRIKRCGLNFLDFTTLNNTFKINWARNFLKNPTSIWNFIPHYIFSQFGGLSFILSCNYNVGKLPVKLSVFHKQVLLAWALIYKHNFSPHTYSIWNNRDIISKNKSLFLESWFRNQIWLVRQLFHEEGSLLSHNEFVARYNLQVTPKEYAVVINAIPTGTLMLFKGIHMPSLGQISLPSPIDSPEGKVCFSSHPRNTNRKIRALFQRDVVSIPYVTAYWNQFIKDINWKKVWMLPHKFLIVNKVKEVSFKIIHKCYPASHYMQKFKKDINTNCSFCDLYPETVLHLFWHCSYTKKLWANLCRFVIDCINENFSLLWENVVLGFLTYPREEEKCYFLINLLIILAKSFIHKSKFINKKPCFIVFQKEIEIYFKMLKDSSNQKAIKTVNICTLYKLFM